jgi:hypothetical protein
VKSETAVDDGRRCIQSQNRFACEKASLSDATNIGGNDKFLILSKRLGVAHRVSVGDLTVPKYALPNSLREILL